MKKQLLLTSLMLAMAFGSRAQEFTSRLKKSFETDDPELIAAEMKSRPDMLNHCFEIKGKPYSLLAISIKTGAGNIFDYLLAGKAELNKSCDDKTPLMYAVKYGKLELVEKLIKAGADINVKNKDGETALDYAVKYEQKTIADYLRTKGPAGPGRGN